MLFTTMIDLASSWDNPFIERAARHAWDLHEGQVRKYTREPYWVHCHAVALGTWERTQTPYVIAAAYLHDTIEDTRANADLLRHLGHCDRTVELVEELTDVYTPDAYPEWNRARRKAAECTRLAGISYYAKLIKLADMADNTSSIVKHDPKFAALYLKEKANILEVIS